MSIETTVRGVTPLGHLRSTRITARRSRGLSIDLRVELGGEATARLDAILLADCFAAKNERFLGAHPQVVTLVTDGREALARALVSVDEVRPDGTLVGTLEVAEDGWDLGGRFEAAAA